MKKIFSIIASAMLIASCTSQTEELVDPIPESQEPEGQKVTLCASIASGEELPAGARNVSGKDSNPGSTTGVINLTWDEGDEVLIKVGEESAVFTLSGGAGTNMGSFTGVMPGDGSSYDVVYPADYNEDVLAEQTYVENGFDNGLMKMSTKTPGTVEGGFTLSADNALVGLQLTGNDELGKIVLSNPADSKTYTLTCTGVKLTSEAKVFYIVVPAGEWANGFNVDVYANDDTRIGILKKASSATFKASTSMAMPTKDVTARYLSICNGRRLVFSHGNLQYCPQNQEWRFAPHQWDNIGKYNTKTNFTNPNYDGWLDLFCWSAEGRNSGLDDISADYSGNFVDWGNNTISGYAPNTWRTMSIDEWEYLLNGRPNATDLRAAATVNGVYGWIFLPDNWTCPAGITFSPGFGYANNIFNIEQWLQIEEAGAIFLPSAGIRRGDGRDNTDNTNDSPVPYGRYWTSTTISSGGNPYYFYILNDNVWGKKYSTGRTHAQSVRLVRNL
ncbi:MAG: hypothetical protein U0L47_01940 [Paludibacteraceae bacterium]|nr:hypothetical protein [Paludibacteraceae bacterium]